VESLNAARTYGCGVVYVTNNASRPPSDVRDHLDRLGLDLVLTDVLTSAQATAAALLTDYAAGTTVLGIGGAGLHEALEEAGFTVVDRADAEPRVVVMGFGPDVSWRHLAEATRALRGGAAFVATNTDLTVPTPFGAAPGNGALVRAVSEASGIAPRVIGKPQPTMFEQATRDREAKEPLVVGDRLDTDIQGAVAAGFPSLLVMSGVTDVLTLLNAPSGQRPTYIAMDLSGLHAAHRAPERVDGVWRCGRASAYRDGVRITVQGDSGVDSYGGDGVDGLRAACAAAWEMSPGSSSGASELIGVTDVVGLSAFGTG
jgi:HAD superfamily hydrolase (TIGR01450 family)